MGKVKPKLSGLRKRFFAWLPAPGAGKQTGGALLPILLAFLSPQTASAISLQDLGFHIPTEWGSFLVSPAVSESPTGPPSPSMTKHLLEAVFQELQEKPLGAAEGRNPRPPVSEQVGQTGDDASLAEQLFAEELRSRLRTMSDAELVRFFAALKSAPPPGGPHPGASPSDRSEFWMQQPTSGSPREEAVA
ncbi:hypothetical protein CYMTET_26657, partial [Cymbomonas tetramitiformis]